MPFREIDQRNIISFAQCGNNCLFFLYLFFANDGWHSWSGENSINSNNHLWNSISGTHLHRISDYYYDYYYSHSINSVLQFDKFVNQAWCTLMIVSAVSLTNWRPSPPTIRVLPFNLSPHEERIAWTKFSV